MTGRVHFVGWSMLGTLGMLLGCASAPPTAPQATVAASAAKDPRAVRIEALLTTGRTMAAQHLPVGAEAALRQAVQLSWGFSAPWTEYRAEGLALQARAVFAQGRGAEARALAESALGLTKPGSLVSDQRISELETTRAESFRSEAHPELAVAPFSNAVAASARHPAALAPALIVLSLRLGDTLQGLGQRLEATKVLERALLVAKKEPGGKVLAPRVATALAPLYDAAGDPRRAQALLAEFGLAAAPAGTPAAEAPAFPGSAAQEMVAMQADFRACYRASLAQDGDVQGRVELVIRIAADGRVVNVKADGSGLPGATVDCLLKRAALAQFEPPQGGGTVITVPVTFVKQENN